MEKQRLIDMLRTAGVFMEGDFLSGRNVPDEQTRRAAREELSALRLGVLNNAILIDDEVSDILAMHLNKNSALALANFTLGEVKDILLGNTGVRFVNEYGNGMSSVLISALGKIMSNEELGAVSRKIFNPLPGPGLITVGSRGHFGSRIQPNSAGDKEEEILFAALDALSYGCGDTVIGLNPACDDVETVMRLENFLAGIVQRLRLPTRFCVLSDIVKQTRARERGAEVDLGFQSLAGTSKALKGVVGIGARDIFELAKAFPGLYFEIGMGLEATNGTDEGVDMRTLTSRAAGLARYIEQASGKWTIVNTVTNFIGRAVFRTEDQLFRAAIEDVFMLKMHGLTGGIDVCAPFDMGIHPERLQAVTGRITDAVHQAFVMSITGGLDELLGYETTSSRAYPALCIQNVERRMTSAMQKRLTELGVLGRCGLARATPDVVFELYAEYQREGGDTRPVEELKAEAKRKVSALQAQGFDIGYGCPVKFVAPERMRKRADLVYWKAQKALVAKVEPSVLRDASEKYIIVRTESLNREDYLNNLETGEKLRQSDRLLRRVYPIGLPDVLFGLSDGLNPDAINQNIRAVLPGVRHGISLLGLRVGDTDIVVMNGRMRVGYDIGSILQVPVLIHFFGERPGTGLDALSVGITWGFDAKGNPRFDVGMDHSCTTAVCGIHTHGKHPDVAVEEIVKLVKLMFEKRRSGVELYSEKTLITA